MPWHRKPGPSAADPCDGCEHLVYGELCEHAACLTDPARPEWRPCEWTCDGCVDPQPECVHDPAVEVAGKTYCDTCVRETLKAIMEHRLRIGYPLIGDGWAVYTPERHRVEDNDLVRAVRAVTPEEVTDAD